MAVSLLSVPAARAQISIFIPQNNSYTTERSVPVMGMITGESLMSERDYVIVTVNNQDTVELDIRDGYFFSGEAYVDDGLNTIAVEGTAVQIYAGDDDTPPENYSRYWGHISADDTCDTCHEPELNNSGSFRSLKLIEPPDTLCNWCHSMTTAPRGKSKLKTIHNPAKDGNCLVCHLSHSGKRPGLLKDEEKALCRSCHEKTFKDLENRSYVHGPLNVVACSFCHSSHASNEIFRLKAPPREVCMECHGGMGIFSEKSSTRPQHPGVQEGRCHDCHYGHTSNNPKMMKKNVNSLCIECHPEKSNNFHEEKGFSIYICGRCHNVHNPDTIYLIISGSRGLCDTCHTELGRGEIFHKVVAEKSCFECHSFHNVSFEKSQSEVCFRCHPKDERFMTIHPVPMSPDARCSSCHSPHRSTTKTLTYPVKHKPFEEKKCFSCHARSDGAVPVSKDRKRYNALCISCHTDKEIPEGGQQTITTHKPFQRESCRTCHLPHNSEYGHLLTSNLPGLCERCHSFTKKVGRSIPASLHPYLTDGKCDKCHDSHMTANKNLFPKKAEDLCLDCHRKLVEQESGIPYPFSHQPAKEGKCFICHGKHFSNNPSLLLGKEITICKGCHESFFAGLNNPENRHRHTPVKNGACCKCHNPHGTTYRFLLKKEGDPLCFLCHTKSLKGSHHESTQEGKKTPCMECHRSHYSPNAKATVDRDNPMCRDCHTF